MDSLAFSDHVLGPHLEEMCRQFVMLEIVLFGDLPGAVRRVGLEELYG
ncbi:hypothetical protein [Nonomuraea diastatica]|nr:hypothetical protein [Nonomuraea diastatica]